MKFVKKLIAVIMALVLICSIATPTLAAQADEMVSPEDYAEYLEDEGVSAITSDDVIGIWCEVSDFFRLMTGNRFPTEETLAISFDEYLVSVNANIAETCGINLIDITQIIPPINGFAEFVEEKTPVDTVALKQSLTEQADKFQANGNTDMAMILRFLAAYMSIIDELYVCALPTADPNVYEISVEMTYRDKTVETIGTQLLINKETGDIYTEKGTGILGIGFNFNVYDVVLYAVVDAWQRNFGFAVIYDEAANAIPFLWDIATRRYHFDYKGLQWRIQAWKGTYNSLASGAEVGIYTRDPDLALGTFYNCASDDQMMTMTVKLFYNDNELLHLGPKKHWWMTGFKFNGKIYQSEQLTLEYTIEMFDEEIVKAFTTAIDNEEHHDAKYTVDGTTVSVVW